jgi:hypothetical protein
VSLPLPAQFPSPTRISYSASVGTIYPRGHQKA